MIHDDKDYEGWFMNGRVGKSGKEIHRLNSYFHHNCGSGHSSFAHSYRNPNVHPILGMPEVTCKKCLAQLEHREGAAPEEISVLRWFYEGWKWRDVRVWYVNWTDHHPSPWRIHGIWEGYPIDTGSLSQILLWFQRYEQRDGSWGWHGKPEHKGDLGYKWPVNEFDKLIVVPVAKDDGWKTRVGQQVVYDHKVWTISRHAPYVYCKTRQWDEPAWCLTEPEHYDIWKAEKPRRDTFHPFVAPNYTHVLVDTVIDMLKTP